MKKIRAFFRLILFVFWTTFMITRLLIYRIFVKDFRLAYKQLRQWAFGIYKILGIHIELKGEIPNHGVLMAPNHRSYIDIPVMNRITATSFVSKDEVRKWILIGTGAVAVQTIFVKREQASSRKRALKAIADAVKIGKTVTVFSEGTTYEGPGILEFRPGIFRISAEYGVPVVPVAIEYKDTDAAWVGDDTFFRHFFDVFGRKRVDLKISVGPELLGDDPEKLRQASMDWISTELKLLQKEYGKNEKNESMS